MRTYMEKTTTLLLFLAAVLLQSAQAIDRICINADNNINKLYVDGQELTKQLPNRGNLKKCDCVEIPPNSGVIAVEATNYKAAAGIQACETSHAAIYQDWRCRPSTQAKSKSWYQPGYKDSTWMASHGHKCQKHCHKYFKTPCPISSSMCYWANKKNSKTVRCRVKQCADDCTDCRNSGPGSCDPGKCRLGDSGLNARGKRICNRRCHLEVKAWGPTEAANGYMKLTDVLTNYVETYSANVAGIYAATVDMTSCKFTNRLYSPWSSADPVTRAFITWNSPSLSPSFSHVIGIGLAVGPAANTYAPMIEVWYFAGNADPDYSSAGSPDGRNHGFSATLFGVQGNTTFNNVVNTY